MGFFQNPEIKKQCVLYVLLTAAGTAMGLFYAPFCGLLLFFICLAFGTAQMAMNYFRYKRIYSLSRMLDRALHGEENIRFSKYQEGELAVLENELNKLMIRLGEQTALLQKEKTFLEDSIADISHQLKTPLTSMSLVLALLEDDTLDRKQRRAYVRELENYITDIDWLVATLLKISRIEGGTVEFAVEKTDAADLVSSAAAPLVIPMELRGQQLVQQIGPGTSFLGDAAWTAEALRNILKNCMEHTDPGGQIVAEANENAIYTEIVIRDNGQGIPKEDLPHIFERFYRGKNSGETSVGIGLALARMIITAQNGTIKAENERTGGARFEIRFYKSVV